MEGDARLVARVKSGDQEAFAELVRRHRVPVFSLAASILGSSYVPDAEDIAQEVFVKVHRGLGSFREDAEFSSWLYRITFNQAVNLKKLARFRQINAGEAGLLAAVSREEGPDEQTENRDRDRALAECIRTLPEVYQSALRLYYWLDMGVAEVSDLLGIPVNTTKSYLHRARLLLQGMLKERGFTNE